MPTAPQDLIAEANCLVCNGVNLDDAIKLALLNRIAGSIPVADFISRAGITDQTQIDAVTALHAAAVANGWWDKCDLIYPFVGGTAQAHAQNLKSSNFTITWNGTVTHDANGITGNGTTGYGNTGYIPASSGQWALDSAHLGIYLRSVGVTSRIFIGSATAADDKASFGVGNFATSRTSGMNDSTFTTLFAASAIAWIMAVRINSTTKHVYNVGLDSSAAAASAVLSPVPFYILARDFNNGADLFSTANIAGVTVGSGFTLAQYTTMAGDFQNFNLALGRAV